MYGPLNTALLCLALCSLLAAQEPTRFEVVSIKRHVALDTSGGTQNLPDGTYIMINQPISTIIRNASLTLVREVIGAPEWVNTERYDVTTKPPAGSTPAQRREMARQMFIDRMKFVGHVEERERDTFALVLARSDGRLGPNLKPSTLDCSPRPANAEAPAPPPASTDVRSSCGATFGATSIVAGAINIDQLLPFLGGLAGGLVNNRTGLKGLYSLELNFSRDGLVENEKRSDEPPQFMTALQEQLGLKLQREKTMVPVLVVDSIERPSEN